jgi:predicted flap endonuclease-1-like 5' DNA nuclease
VSCGSVDPVSTRKLSDDAFSPEFPRAIGRPANAALVVEGFTTLEQVARLSEKELLAIHGVGPKAVAILREELAAQDLQLAD